MGERVTNIEAKMREFTTSFNDLLDAHSEKAEHIEWMKAKLEDLEDRSRRNNIKIRGIPESVQQPALKEYFTQLMVSVELIIDCIQ